MASTFLQSSLLITISESDSTSRGVILVKNHLRANIIISDSTSRGVILVKNHLRENIIIHLHLC